jgi:hypothetical protein
MGHARFAHSCYTSRGTVFRPARRGGLRAVVAESVLVKHQLLIPLYPKIRLRRRIRKGFIFSVLGLGGLDPFTFLVVSISGWMNQHQHQVIEYLIEENRVLREQIGNRRMRFRWWSGQRCRGQVPSSYPRCKSRSVPSEPAPSIFTAIQDQLGLRLESTRGPAPVLVIEHVERPTEN